MNRINLLNDIYKNPVRKRVEDNIRRIYKNTDVIYNPVSYTVCLNEQLKQTYDYNKRMRPFLIWLWSIAAWLKQNDVLGELATTIELIHQSTLPADDIQDKSENRCWKQALWKKVWTNTTIDIILLLAASGPTYYANILWKDKNWILHDYSDFLLTTLINLVSWQELDLKANEWWKTIDDYYKIVDGKTGALLDLALHFGTMPYEYLYTEEKSQAITEFAMELARLYQICDDIDDIKKWNKLDPSNIHNYADITKNPEKMDKIYQALYNKLEKAHNKLLELKVVKENYLMELANVLLPKEEFDIKMLIK